MIIEVKLDHIRNGAIGSFCDCPVALAMKDAGLANPWVTEYSIWKNVVLPKKDFGVRLCDTPKTVVDFIRKFDKEIQVDPFSFEIEHDDNSTTSL